MVDRREVLYPEFGARVREAMKKHHVTKQDVMRVLDDKKGEMSRRYIAGMAKPRHDKMLKLARLLKMASAAALEYGDVGNVTAPPAAAQLSLDALDIAGAYEKLSPTLQTSVRTMVFAMASAHSVAPWLAIGAPRADGYAAWEKAIEKAYQTELKQLQLNLEA